MPKKIYNRKFSNAENAYYKRVSSCIEYAHYFDDYYIQQKGLGFCYFDITQSFTDDYDLFKYANTKFKQNILEKLGIPCIGFFERPTSKPFYYHTHYIGANSYDNIDQDFMRKGWKDIGVGFGADSKQFKMSLKKPWLSTPYKKFYYSIKSFKVKPWLKSKPYGQSGSFFTYSNLPELPWEGQRMPKDHFTPRRLNTLMYKYFTNPSVKRKRKVLSLFEFKRDYLDVRFLN